MAQSPIGGGARAGDILRSGAGGMSAAQVMQQGIDVAAPINLGSQSDGYSAPVSGTGELPSTEDDLKRVKNDQGDIKRVKLPPRPDK